MTHSGANRSRSPRAVVSAGCRRLPLAQDWRIVAFAAVSVQLEALRYESFSNLSVDAAVEAAVWSR